MKTYLHHLPGSTLGVGQTVPGAVAPLEVRRYPAPSPAPTIMNTPTPTITPHAGIANWPRSFWSLFAVQFQGAFSDNLFKFLVIFLARDLAVNDEQYDNFLTLALVTFSVPFILFSMAAGHLSDKFSKQSLVFATKTTEVGIMVLGTIGLMMESLPMLYFVIFLMSAQSAFFSPAKYGLLPEILPEKKLSWGNGFLGLGTFVSIILGGYAAGLLFAKTRDSELGWGLLLVGLAVVGWLMSFGIAKVPAADPKKVFHINFVAELDRNLRRAAKNRTLFIAILGATFFWFMAALLGDPAMLVYNEEILHLSEDEYGILRAFLAIGIAVGSVLAGILSGKKIEYGLIPLGSLGLTASAALMSLPGLSPVMVKLFLFLIGVSGGFFIVPINALVQHLPEKSEKGTMIATEGWMTSLGVFLATAFFWVLRTAFDLSAPGIFIVGSLLTLVATLYVLWLVPDSFARLVIWALTHTVYRVRVEGRDNIPERGGALFVCNHVSLADACFLIASTDRQIRFIMHKSYYEKWWLNPIARMLRVIPISSELRPREMIKSLQAATDWIKEGHVVCIFAEGQITRTGQMLPFRKGFQRIMKGVDAPIIPVNLDGVWGSIFSFEKGRFYTKLPHELPYPVTVSYGEPFPATADPGDIRGAVQELGATAWEIRKSRLKPLHREFVATARRHKGRAAFGNGTEAPMSYFKALVGTILLGKRLRPVWQSEDKVGLLLPPSSAGAMVNYAALLAGKVPVNLNYTLSSEGIGSCVKQAGINQVIASRRFVEQAKLKLPFEPIYLEDIAADFTTSEKVSSMLLATLAPVSMIESALGSKRKATMDDLCTIIFSSGSTGEPKGVMLSHYNIVSNVKQLGQVFALGGDDRFLGVLPFFHSFGFTGTLGVPAMLGVGVAYHPNPLDAKTIGQIIQEQQVTFMIATPTFLQLYLRGCQPAQLGSLRNVLAGAEKLPARVADAFEDKFGIRPFEAYGCTECAPGVAVNTNDFRAAGYRQVGHKRGTIGHPLPGVTVRIVDPETGETLPNGNAGLMLVKGPNVMMGYLGMPEKTSEVLKDGWYHTGDIAAIDEDGFITITDRMSRFSKIGGEMVPHLKVEEALHDAAGVTETTFVVTGLPDEKKGERLAVVHTLAKAEDLDRVLEKLATADLPNLWKPKKNQFVKVDALPKLGTGKLDLRGVKELAKG